MHSAWREGVLLGPPSDNNDASLGFRANTGTHYPVHPRIYRGAKRVPPVLQPGDLGSEMLSKLPAVTQQSEI